MRIQANSHAGKFRVFHNQRDITNTCFEADDREGWAKVYRHNDDGTPMLMSDGSGLQWDILWGAVQIKAVELEYATK